MTTRFNCFQKDFFYFTNSHKFVNVVDAGGVPVLFLFLSGHLYHLILLRSNAHDVSVLAIVTVVTFCPELVAHATLVLGGTLGVFLGEQLIQSPVEKKSPLNNLHSP